MSESALTGRHKHYRGRNMLDDRTCRGEGDGRPPRRASSPVESKYGPCGPRGEGNRRGARVGLSRTDDLGRGAVEQGWKRPRRPRRDQGSDTH